MHTPGGRPFTFIDNDMPEHQALVRAIGLDYILTGWTKLDAGRASISRLRPTMHRIGGKTAVCVECGGHEDASSVDVGRESILRALRHCGMLSGQEPPPKPATVIEFSKVVFKDGEGTCSVTGCISMR